MVYGGLGDSGGGILLSSHAIRYYSGHHLGPLSRGDFPPASSQSGWPQSRTTKKPKHKTLTPENQQRATLRRWRRVALCYNVNMSTRSFSFANGEFYHVYNRGVDKRTIYKTPKDHYRFLERMYLANGTKRIDIRSIKRNATNLYEWDRGEQLVAIGAYCLMPNHFHILLTPLMEGGVATFMNKLATSYSMYFNKHYERTGTLFEGKFKAQWADTDQYLKYLYAYIHLNPVKLIQSDWRKAGIENMQEAFLFCGRYEYSSLAHYLGAQFGNPILSPSYFPEYFRSPTTHKEELLEWLSFTKGDPL